MSEATLPLQAVAPPRFSEDLVAVGLGLLVFLLALVSLAGADALGWLVTTSVWSNPAIALAPVSRTYASLGGAGSLLLTYLVLTAVLSAAAYLLGDDVKRFAAAFTGVFVIALCELVPRLLGVSRRGHPGRSGQVRRLVVAQAHERGRLHCRASRGPCDRERLPGFR